MKKHLDERLLSLYLDRCLRGRKARLARAHLEQCPSCRELYAEMARARDFLAGTRAVSPGPGLAEKIIDKIPADTPRPVFSRPGQLGLAAATLVLLFIIARVALEHEPRFLTEKAPGPPAIDGRDAGPPPGELAQPHQLAEPPAEEAEPHPAPAPPEQPAEPDIDAERPVAPGEAPPPPDGPAVRRPGLRARAEMERGPEKPEMEETFVDRLDRRVSPEITGRPAPEPAPSRQMFFLAEDADAVAEEKETEVIPETLVITDRESWLRTWNAQQAVQRLEPVAPEIDFREEIVVALPERQSGRVFRVVEAFEENDRAVLNYREEPDDDPRPDSPLQYQFNIINRRAKVELRRVDQ